MTDATAARATRPDRPDRPDRGPVFSTTDRGGRITGLDLGQEPVPLTGVAGPATLALVVWGVVGLLASQLCDVASSPWWTVVGLAGLAVATWVAARVTLAEAGRARDGLGQRRAPALLVSAPLLAGLALGLGGWTAYRAQEDTADVVAVVVPSGMALLCVLGLLVVAIRLPGALRHARGRQATIARLRREGRRTPGRLALGEVALWFRAEPELAVTVTHQTPAGPQVVHARMSSTADRVPQDGSAMVVLTGADGLVHLELDREAGPVFVAADVYAAPVD